MNNSAKTFNNLPDLISFFTQLTQSWKNNYVFRGYSSDQQMVPRLIRKYSIKDEIPLLSDFEKYALSYINNIISPLDLLAYGQHFGLPTRLLDFTYNPYIALYFAFYHDSQEDDYRYIRYCDLNENVHFNNLPLTNNISGLNSTNVSLAKDYGKMIEYLERSVYDNSKQRGMDMLSFYDDTQNVLTRNLTAEEATNSFASISRQKLFNKKLLFIEPSLSNPRIVLQQGLFLFPYITDREELTEMINKNTTVIRINKSLRKDILDYLDIIGVNTFKIMPDLPSICSEIIRRYKVC